MHLVDNTRPMALLGLCRVGWREGMPAAVEGPTSGTGSSPVV
jgi:hypothetical protein